MAELAALSLSASCGRLSENEKAQRSKVIGAPSRNKLWAPQESRDTRMTVFKKFNMLCTCGGTGSFEFERVLWTIQRKRKGAAVKGYRRSKP